MTLETRGLIVDDDPEWQRALGRALGSVCSHLDFAADTDRAWIFLNSWDYDLVTVDLSLVADVAPERIVPNEKGFELLMRLRQSNRDVRALVIVTGFPNWQRVRDAFVEYRVDDFVEKIPRGQSFDPEAFATRMRRVLFESRLRAASRKATERCRATIVATSKKLISGAIDAPGQRGMVLAQSNSNLDLTGFADDADSINDLVPAGGTLWRASAKEIGTHLYKSLMSHPASGRLITQAHERTTRKDPAVIEFAGPAALLRVPFELMTTGNDYVCFDSVVTRRLIVDDMTGSQSSNFHEFIAQLSSADQPLNILLVGVNSDGTVPGTEMEVEEIAAGIARTLGRMNLLHSIETLVGKVATRSAVRERLSSGTVHVFHYAGHGRFDDIIPEDSGVIVDVGSSRRTLSAAELKQMLAGSGVQLAFLSCCVGAQTAQDVHGGDFHGPLEAVARAGVPTVIGYRWVVPDEPARRFALTFYEELFVTFSPGIAMLRARQAAAADPQFGRNNPMWAAPIIITSG